MMQLINIPNFTDDPEWVELDTDAYVFWLQNCLVDRVTPYDEDSNFAPMFQLQSLPPITMKEYVDRIVNYMYFFDKTQQHMTVSPYILTQILICRFFAVTNQRISPVELDGIHKLFATTFYIALKISLDMELFSFNGAYLFGLIERELAYLERRFLHYINYHISIEPESFAESADSYFVSKRITNFAQRRHWIWYGAREAFSGRDTVGFSNALDDSDLSSDEAEQNAESMTLVPLTPLAGS